MGVRRKVGPDGTGRWGLRAPAQEGADFLKNNQPANQLNQNHYQQNTKTKPNQWATGERGTLWSNGDADGCSLSTE